MMLFPKTIKIMLAIYRPQEYKKNISNIAKHTDVTYSHTTKTIIELENCKYINTKLEGRDKIIAMTPRGVRLFGLLDEVDKLMRECDNGNSKT